MSFLKKFIFKRFLLGVTVACMVLNSHAQWDKKWFHYVGAAYPFTKAAVGFLAYCADQRVQLGTNFSEYQYPRALAYVRSELEKAGIDHSKIDIAGVEPGGSFVTLGGHHLHVPLGGIENVLQKRASSKEQSDTEILRYLVDKTTISHEIGHLRNNRFGWRVFLPFIVTVSTCYASARVKNSFIRESLRFFVPLVATRAIEHIDEYRADSYAMNCFKGANSHVLWARAHRNLWLYNCGLLKLYHPFFLTMRHWLIDSHASLFARANRFLKAAGIPSTQTALYHEIKRQSAEHPGEIDMQAVIDFCKESAKNCAEAEIPEVFETYGQ